MKNKKSKKLSANDLYNKIRKPMPKSSYPISSKKVYKRNGDPQITEDE